MSKITEQQTLPHNILAEQAVLGALMLNNELMPKISRILSQSDFYDPVHSRIFRAIERMCSRGMLASPVTLKTVFENDEGMSELGGADYLARVAGATISIVAAPDYAQTIRELSVRRDLVRIGLEAQDRANDFTLDADAIDIILEAETALSVVRQRATTRETSFSWKSLITDAIKKSIDAHTGKSDPMLSTGLKPIDDVIGGYSPGDLIILAGRPSMGKTALAIDLATRRAKTGDGVIIASLEMSGQKLTIRAASSEASADGQRIPYNRINKGQLSDEQMERVLRASSLIENLNIRIIDRSVRNLAQIRSEAIAAKKAMASMNPPVKTTLLVLDYLQLVKIEGTRNRHEEVGAVSKALKQLAVDLDLTVIALSQLSRQVESRDDKRPVMADLRESGSIEEDADVICMSYREEYYLSRQKPPMSSPAKLADWEADMAAARGRFEAIIVKNREGATSTAVLGSDVSTNRFWDIGDETDRSYEDDEQQGFFA